MVTLSKEQKKIVKKNPIKARERKKLELSIQQQLGLIKTPGVDTLSDKELKQLEIDCADTLSWLPHHKEQYGDMYPLVVAYVKKIEKFVKAEIQGRKDKKKG